MCPPDGAWGRLLVQDVPNRANKPAKRLFLQGACQHQARCFGQTLLHPPCFLQPPSCHSGGSGKALSPTEDCLPALPTRDFLGVGGSQVTIFLGSPLAPGYSVHFLTVTWFDCDLIGSMQNPDCSIIIRQRNYWSIKGCSQLLD